MRTSHDPVCPRTVASQRLLAAQDCSFCEVADAARADEWMLLAPDLDSGWAARWILRGVALAALTIVLIVATAMVVR